MKVLVYRDPKKPFVSYEERYYHNLKNYILKINDDEVVSDIDGEYDIAHFIGVESKNQIQKIKKEKNCPICITYNIVRKTRKEYDDPSLIKLPFDDVKILNLANVIICPSSSDKAIIENNKIEVPVFVIGPGTKKEKFYTMNELEMKAFAQYASLNKTDSYALSVINPNRVNDIEMIVELGREFKNLKFFIFVKKTSFFKTPHRSLSLLKKLPKNMKCVDLVDEDLYKSALLNAKYFIVPSEPSLALNVIYDAMITKTPIFSLYSFDIDEILIDKKNAYISFNVEQLKNRLHEYEDGKIPSLVDEAYNIAKEDSFEKVAQKLKKVYDSLF